MNIEKGAADRRLAPRWITEVIAHQVGLGRLLLFYDRYDQTGKGNEYKQELKQFFICNHIHITTPFRLGQGAKKDHPLKRGG